MKSPTLTNRAWGTVKGLTLVWDPPKRLTCARRGPTVVGPYKDKQERQSGLEPPHSTKRKAKAHRLKPVPRKADAKSKSHGGILRPVKATGLRMTNHRTTNLSG